MGQIFSKIDLVFINWNLYLPNLFLGIWFGKFPVDTYNFFYGNRIPGILSVFLGGEKGGGGC